ncbi:MAG: ComF family protein [Betaproteobacteria bacterium]
MTAFAYGFPLDRLVQRFKYGGDLAIGGWLASALAQRVAHESRPQLLVAPPLTRARLRERGFNQALEVAKVVGQGMRVRCSLHGVRRRHEDAPQAGLSRRERLANLRDAFDCREDVRGLDVAVVDDVLTTGATAEAMARALKKSGACRVRVWAVARTLEPGDV